MGPPENPTGHPENQEGRRKRLPLRPRMRRCLLKGCEERFHPRQARQRYCGEGCREAARKWSRRKAPEPDAVNDPARIITTEHFFRSLLRPAGLLRGIRACAAKSLTALLLTGVPARAGARPRTGAAVEAGA